MCSRFLDPCSPLICALIACLLAAAFDFDRAHAGTIGADAVVLVNSSSPSYLDFQHRLQPYLDNFGVPYTVLDIATNSIDTNIARFAVMIIGHGQLDLSGGRLGADAQNSIVSAVSNGVGLVNFDAALASGGGAARYPFVQSIFGFGYGPPASAGNVSFVATEPGALMHFITARHQPGEAIALRSSMTLPGLVAPSNVTSLAFGGGQPLVAVTKFGQGRAVQWGSCDWMSTSILGPIEGLDDLVWRSIVWAARKPFVMRSLPNFVTMRVDDASGDAGADPFWWIKLANSTGFKPYLSLFLDAIDDFKAAALRGLVTNGLATTSIHSFNCCDHFFYFNHAAGTPYPDSTMSNNILVGGQWHANHGIPISKVMVAHYSEIGANAFPGLRNWGVQFTVLMNYPGTIQNTPWLALGPYRLYEGQQSSVSTLPFYYADFLSIPGHPELDGQFFNCVTEIRDDASCNEWCPDNNVAASIGRGTRQLKRALDSLALATLQTHEWYFVYIPQKCMTISPTNWQAILQGITNNLAAYHPTYVTLDYACQYVRATRTSRLVSSAYDSVSGEVTATFSGQADLDTQVCTYSGEDNSITSVPRTVLAFTQPQTVQVAGLLPPRLSVSITKTNSLVLAWPGYATAYVLQQKANLGAKGWLAVTNAPVTVGSQIQVIVADPQPSTFFRLCEQPPGP
jgi:hypothetical protein